MPRLSKLSRSIAGRVALITGAASGIGRATAHLFADEGARVAVTDVKSVQKVVAEIREAEGNAYGWVLDVSDGVAVRRNVAEIVEHFGGLDIVVNNAGVSLFSPLDGDDFEECWSRSLDVMLTAHANIIRAALPHLRKSDLGEDERCRTLTT